MRKFTLFIVAILAIFAAGWIGYALYPSASGTEQNGRVNISEQSKTRVVIERATDTPADAAVERSERTASRDPDPARYISWQVYPQGATPKVCFLFSESLSGQSETSLKKYVRVTPETPFSLEAQGRELCILGLDYAKDYDVRLLDGLTFDADLVLNADVSERVSFGDKPAFVGFAGEGIILPRTQGGKLTLKTMNVEAVKLSIYRVNDRIVSQNSPNAGEAGVEGNYSYGAPARQTRVEIWSDELKVESIRNTVVQTGFDLRDRIAEQGPGVFVVHIERADATERDWSAARSWRWIVSTDLALASYRGDDGIQLTVRSIETAKRLAGVRLDLVADNNEVLADAVTDAEGRAVFAGPLLNGSGPSAPRMIMAYGPNGDYALLDLSRAPLDLTAMDVTGRTVIGDIDLFAYPDRGIFRPGETVHLSALMRNRSAEAVKERGLKYKISQPNGTVMSEGVLPPSDKAGGFVLDYRLPDNAPRGRWSMRLGVDGGDWILTERVTVEDFVPQRIEATLKADPAPVLPTQARDIELTARFLYGAPGADLDTEMEARLQRDNRPFPEFSDYRFGDSTVRFSERLLDLVPPLTNTEGKTVAKLDVSSVSLPEGVPVRAAIKAGVSEPGGRYVYDSLFLPIRADATFIGFDPQFENYAAKAKPTDINLIAVNRLGDRIASKLDWTLIHEDRNWHWYRENGNWRYRRDVRSVEIDKGTLDISATSPTLWSYEMNYGSYRLETTAADGTEAVYEFYVGWSGRNSSSDAPDRIAIGIEALPRRAGDDFVLTVNSPVAGTGDLVIADSNIRSVRSVTLPKGASRITVPYERNWGPGVHAMLTVYTPLDKASRTTPKRAVGLVHVGLDMTDRTFDVAIGLPEKIRPRQTVEVPVQISGVRKGDIWVTLAAVDQGILALTNFQSPDAAATLYGKAAFGLDVRDDYSRILNPFMDGTDRSGGDGIGGAGLTVVPTKTVALFNGPVKLRDGKALIPLDIPDFNGQLRFMVTAWSDRAVGSASRPIIVRDPVPANVSLPRFLAPGDTAQATVSLDNVDGEAGQYSVTIASSDLTVEGAELSFDLPQGERRDQVATLSSDANGVTDVTMSVKGPGGYALTSRYDIQTRSPFRPLTHRISKRLQSGETFNLDPNEIAELELMNATGNLAVTRLMGLDVNGYVSSLSRYPYGCTEQITSRSMPLVFLDSIPGAVLGDGATVGKQIDTTVATLATRQDTDGVFGLWRVSDGNANPWLQLYATEFLLVAKDRGHAVPDHVVTKAVSAAKALSQLDGSTRLDLDFKYGWRDKDVETRKYARAAYAHYIRVLAGEGSMSEMRYLHDRFGDKISGSLPQSYLGRAFTDMGDTDRAATAFERAKTQFGNRSESDYYITTTRDMAGLVSLGGDALIEDTLSKFTGLLAESEPRYASTQEKAYIVRAIDRLTDSQSEIVTQVDGLDLTDNKAVLSTQALKNSATIKNTGEGAVWVALDVTGVPIKTPPATAEGFEVRKKMYSMDGTPITSTTIKRGDRIVVTLDVKQVGRREAMIVMADLLPAGLEIETILTPGMTNGGKDKAFGWVNRLSRFDMAEARDDRFVASLRTRRYGNNTDIRAAYVVRAVTVGDFVMPGLSVEDMYRPRLGATTLGGRLTIQPAGAF